MKKSTLLLFIFVITAICFGQDTVTVFDNKFTVNGDLTCHCSASPHNGEDRINPWIDCYAEIKNDSLIYYVVISVDSINVGFDQYRIAITDLELNKAKTDWEHHYFISIIKRLDIPNKAKFKVFSYRSNNYRYNHDLPPIMDENFSMHFSTDKEAKAFLKKLKKEASIKKSR